MDGATANSLTPAWAASPAIGLFILYISIFTVTISHWSLPYLRLALAPIAIVFFWKVGFGPYDEPSRMSPGISLYFIGRVLEHSLVTFWDATPPHWVMRAQSSDGSRIVLPLPNTFKARCVYALDLLTSVRGLSWFADLEWSWVSHSLPSQAPISRRDFILSNVRSLLLQYLMYDLCDAVLMSRSWDVGSPHPLSDLPIAQQCLFAATICAIIPIPMVIIYTLISIIAVSCGSSPSTWPPLFGSFFASRSLRDFWSHRWHKLFRHIFERLSLPLVRLFLFPWGGAAHTSASIVRFMRTVAVFALSTLFHLFIMQRIALVLSPNSGRTDIPAFFDRSLIWFFLLQPLGFVVESTIVEPLASRMFPAPLQRHTKTSRVHTTPNPSHNGHANGDAKLTRVASGGASARWEKDAIMKLYAWMFLIWTGRWLCDNWVRCGILAKDLKAGMFSPARGLWEGRWVL